jgi:N-acylneuraminate cytidylyltransferase
MRPKELADDFVGTTPVVKHAIQWFLDQECPVNCACCIYATAPFVQPEDLVEAYYRLSSSDKSLAFSVASFAYPIQRSFRITAEAIVEPMFPEYIPARSQDLEEAYHDAGQFYFGTTLAWMEDVNAFSAASIPIVLPRYRVQDIDTPEDWTRAELLYSAWQSTLKKQVD